MIESNMYSERGIDLEYRTDDSTSCFWKELICTPIHMIVWSDKIESFLMVDHGVRQKRYKLAIEADSEDGWTALGKRACWRFSSHTTEQHKTIVRILKASVLPSFSIKNGRLTG